MGFFKDLNTLKQQGKEASKKSDPGKNLRDMTGMMADLNQTMEQSNAALAAPPADAVDATAQVVSVAAASGFMNGDSIVPVELLVLQPGMPPRPASIAVIVPITQAHRLQPGATLPVKVSRSDPSALVIDWLAPA
jgi:hypothetical protein